MAPRVSRKLILTPLFVSIGVTLLVVTALFYYVPPPRYLVAQSYPVVVITSDADNKLKKPKLDVHIKKEVHYYVRQDVRSEGHLPQE